ncbi:sensor histidine kinase [Nocardia pseudobrasiliensis]|uniref:histidine kinase n=1 Tax=Nocardia pseudobrasiliensis TaxID=45979 RepID=A0A370I3S8_9NOCA|nr:HAMP domain-containing sensor histidine kinase [Nocardia pseudobrasiliensis]RDI65383.1 signal transduction histidine kinase [Nocardia pseudobrasiliensis]
MTGRDPRPAVARLRRTRWRLTVLFTAITAICLIVFGAFAATIDARSRQRALDDRVDRIATGLTRDVFWDEKGGLDLELLREDDLAQGTASVAVLSHDATAGWREAFGHRRPGLPTDARLAALAADAATEGEQIIRTVPSNDGHPVRVAAVPSWNSETQVGAVVFAAVDPAPGERDHDGLVLALELGGAALIALAAAAGHLLSGLSMRSALRMLDDQERFLADAAHELRTPLATLRLHTDAGLREPDRATTALTDVRRLADRMGRLVTGLLARTRTQTGVVRPDAVRLRLDQLVEAVVAECGPDIALSAEPTVVQADPDLLTLAVRNLVDNALVHGGGRVEVSVAAGRVSVRDHGAGVDATLGDPFTHGTTGSPSGHGIGLSIVRWVAQLHDGSAIIEAAPDGGTLAVLALPEISTASE